LKLLATCAPERIAVIEEKEGYDSLDAFCAEYGFDAAIKQRMRDDMRHARDRVQDGYSRIRKRADRAIRARRTQLPNGNPRQVGRG